MVKFVFNLEPLYDYRQRLEELSQKEFCEAMEKLEAEEGRLTHLKGLYARSCADIDALKEKGAEAHELNLYYLYLEGLKRHIQEQEKVLKEVRGLFEKKREELLSASRDKKAVEIIRERSLAAHNERAGRQEQKEADDLVNSRYARGAGDEK